MKSNRSKYSENSGFKIPEDYFKEFEERMMMRLTKQEESNLPLLESGFSVPEAYFESLEDKIIQKTEGSRTKVRPLFRKEYLFYAAAVAAIFVLMLGNFFKAESYEPIGWDDIEISAMEEYLDEGYGFIDFNSSQYSEIIISDGKLIDDSDFYMVNSDAVFDYIDQNIEDPTYILEE